MWTIVLCLAITAGIVSQPGGIELYTYMYDHWLPLTSAALVNATFQAVFVYVNSFYSGELLALGGNSGVFIYDVSLSLSSFDESHHLPPTPCWSPSLTLG